MKLYQFTSKHWTFLVGLLLVSIVFHSYNLDYASYDLDEAVHIWHAQKPFSDVVEQSSNDPNPPIYNLLLSGWVKSFGVSEWATRFLSVLFGSLGVCLMYLIASRNFGLAVGIMAALLYCFSPIQFRFTHLARPYSLLMVTVLMSYGSLFEALKKPTKRWLVFYYLASTLMVYIHPTSVFNLAAQGCIVLGFNTGRISDNIKFLIPMIASVLTFGIWVMSIPYFERNDTMWFGPPNWEDVMYVIRVFYANIWLILLQLVLLGIIVFLAIKNKVRSENKIGIGSVLLWVIVPFVISIVFSHLAKPVFQDKYILSVQPAMMLLLALSIDSIPLKWFRMVGFAGAFVLLLSSTDTTQNPEGDWRQAVEYVKPLHTENSVVFIDPWYEFRTFSYYFNKHAFEVPDSTVKILASNRVFTGWHDVYDTLNHQPKTDVVHLMLAHQDFVNGSADLALLEQEADLIDEKKFIGINLKSFRFHLALDTVANLIYDFEDKTEGVERISTEVEFSKTLVYPFTDLDATRRMRVSSSVQVSEESDLKDVHFVTSIEDKSGKSVLYQHVYPNQYKPEAKWLNLLAKSSLNQIDTNWVLKVYVWNPTGKEFRIDNLKVIIEN